MTTETLYSSDAFRQEYHPQTPKDSLYKDIESYLGEYRFQLPRYDYQLVFSSRHLRDAYEDESMVAKAQRAIQRREFEWRKTDREKAELEGFLQLDRQLQTAKNGDVVIWASPPGPQEEGYGDYGFVYLGDVVENESSDKTILMTAYRVEHPTLDQFNDFLGTNFKNSEDFLANPQVILGNKAVLEMLLSVGFDFKDNDSRETEFRKTLQKLAPHIERYISMVRSGASKKELQQVFHMIENYALDTDSSPDLKFDQIVATYNYQPPVAAGSCGSTGSIANGLNVSNNILSLTSSLNTTAKENNFHCPSCHKESTPPIGDSCPKCGITKEEASEKGISTC